MLLLFSVPALCRMPITGGGQRREKGRGRAGSEREEQEDGGVDGSRGGCRVRGNDTHRRSGDPDRVPEGEGKWLGLTRRGAVPFIGVEKYMGQSGVQVKGNPHPPLHAHALKYIVSEVFLHRMGRR